MRIALIAPPFISVPPATYGGTELFVANLARGLHARGHDVIVYANGDSQVPCRLKWRYPHNDWPPTDPWKAHLKHVDHTGWAVHHAAPRVDIIHVQDFLGLPFGRFVDPPMVLTLHHPHEEALSEMYQRYPFAQYVAISEAQARRERIPRIRVVPHGLDLSEYVFREPKQNYLAFLGRMAPCKGAHLAIEVARRAGLPLKLAGEVQPIFREYWEQQVQPHIDGDRVEWVGEVDPPRKNELLANARALLFPIQWQEPFGLVMVEAMACGTPVLAFPGGAVDEVVRDGVSGWICRDVDEMAERARSLSVGAASCRAWVEDQFSRDRMIDGYVEVYERTRRDAARGGSRREAGHVAAAGAR